MSESGQSDERLPDGITCRGSYALGTACGKCKRCDEELAKMSGQSETLMPCPFCGSEAELKGGPEWGVECTKLGVCMGNRGVGCTYKEDAIELWNRRASCAPKEDAAEVEEVIRKATEHVWHIFHPMKKSGVDQIIRDAIRVALRASHRSPTPEAETLTKCVITGENSRVCEMGTKSCEIRHPPAPERSEAQGVPEILFDGYKVYMELFEHQKRRTSTDNVSDVLDALVRIFKRLKSRPATSGDSAPSVAPSLNNTQVQRGEKNPASGADQQRRIVGERTPTVKTQALPRSDADETGGVTAGETANSTTAGAVAQAEKSSPWIKTSELKPSANDGDDRGQILIADVRYNTQNTFWHSTFDYEYWMPIPPLPSAMSAEPKTGS